MKRIRARDHTAAELFERFKMQASAPAGGADERLALPVLLVVGLLAKQHQAGPPHAGAENRLGCVLIEVAAPARRFCRAQVL